MTFESLGLAEPILRAVAADGYAAPTPIQGQAIPHVLAGRDLLGCAHTGTGKTAAFALPLLHRLFAGVPAPAAKSARRVRVLVLCPTRELAAQIGESFNAYGRHLPVRHAVIFGGVNQFHQVRALKSGVDILVATPGRLLDLMNQGHVRLNDVECLVLDEADRMLDMGFIHDIRKVVKHTPSKRQTLLFSATMPGEIRALAGSILREPVGVQVDPVSSTVEKIAQSVCYVPRKDKPALLAHLLGKAGAGRNGCRALVFTRTKHGADKVVKQLLRSGITAEAIHGNKSQNARLRALSNFKSSRPPVLVATDIASRGLDVDGVTHVVNFDIPHEPEAYVHRIGRTARAGAEGVAISLCDHEERGDFQAIQRLTGAAIAVVRDLPAFSQSPAPALHAAPPRTERRPVRDGSHSRNGAPKKGAKPGSGRGPAHNAKGGKPRTAHPMKQSSAPSGSAPNQHRHAPTAAAHGSRAGFMQRGRGRPRPTSR